MRTPILATVLFIWAASSSLASQINTMSLKQLQATAEIVALGQVTAVRSEGDLDHVAIQADTFLKGSSPETSFTFTLATRGDLKNFDPVLKKGAHGLFFLKKAKGTGKVTKTYWGSYAVFQSGIYSLLSLIHI